MSDSFSLDDFSGTARLFPLPNLVMFPAAIQPLHIFEPRYKEMIKDALADDRLLALVLLQPGYEEDYYSAPAICSTACLGRIVQEEELPDGRYNFLFHGISRLRIVEELTTDNLYRSAQVEILRDHRDCTAETEHALRGRLRNQINQWFATHSSTQNHAETLFDSDLTLSTLCDIFSFALPLDLMFKQRLLEAREIQHRTELLLNHLRELTPDPKLPSSEEKRKFPPDFSVN